MKKHFFSKGSPFFKGFSLVEITVALGMLGLVSLGMGQFLKNQLKFSKNSEADAEITVLSTVIGQMLFNKEACINTLGDGLDIKNGVSLSEIKNRANDVIFNITDEYGNGILKINSITLEGVNFKGTATANRYGEVKLKVVFEKLSKILTGNKIVSKSFLLQLEVDSLSEASKNKLVKCYSHMESAIETAIEETCKIQGGTYDHDKKGCTFTNVNYEECKANEVIVGFGDDGKPICKVIHEGSLCTPVWTPLPGSKGKNVTFTQIDGCGNSREAIGTGCLKNWTPAKNTVNLGKFFNQSDGCGNTRQAQGTKCVPYWYPKPQDVVSGTTFVQEDGCGKKKTSVGTCVASWMPKEIGFPSGTKFTQTDGCGGRREGTGSCVSSWTPLENDIPRGKKFTQRDGCGKSREKTGNKCEKIPFPRKLTMNQCKNGFPRGCKDGQTITCNKSQYAKSCTSGNYIDFICRDNGNYVEYYRIDL